MLGVIAGQDTHDSTSVNRPVPEYVSQLDGSVRGLRIGIPRVLNQYTCNPMFSAYFEALGVPAENLVYSDYTTVSAQLKAGMLRALAVGSRQRFAGLPDVPTLPELGLTDYEAESWNGVLAPAKMPKDTLAQLEGWFAAAGRSTDIRASNIKAE